MKVLRWIGIILLIVVVLLVGFGVYVVNATNARLNATMDIDVEPIDIPTSEEDLAEGQRLYVTRGCGDCHGANGAGGVFLNEPPLAVFGATNLTSGEGGVGGEYEVEDWVRAIRHGVGADGQVLWFMPSNEFTHFTNSDVGKLIAYIESLEPVDGSFDERSVGPVGRMLFFTNQIPLVPAELIDHDNVAAWDVEVAASAEYGEYLAQGCKGCHGATYSGGPIPGGPPGVAVPTNITFHETGIQGWTVDDFKTAIREGTRPDGSQLDEFMPWRAFGQMTDVELEAIYMYLETVEPKPEGNR